MHHPHNPHTSKQASKSVAAVHSTGQQLQTATVVAVACKQRPRPSSKRDSMLLTTTAVKLQNTMTTQLKTLAELTRAVAGCGHQVSHHSSTANPFVSSILNIVMVQHPELLQWQY
jgi:hypothetical protein